MNFVEIERLKTPKQRGKSSNSFFLFQDNISSIYTSGRKCNFQGKGCDAAHFDPININGWFWAGASNKRLPSTNQKSPDTFWSKSGP